MRMNDEFEHGEIIEGIESAVYCIRDAIDNLCGCGCEDDIGMLESVIDSLNEEAHIHQMALADEDEYELWQMNRQYERDVKDCRGG